MFSSVKNNKSENDDNQRLTFQSTFYGASTSKLARDLYSFLGPKDRGRMSMTSVDAYRFDKVDRALTKIEFKIEFMQGILDGITTKEYKDNCTVWRNPSGFLRLKDVMKFVNPGLLAQLPKASNVRLNYWPGDVYANLGASFAAETRHSHPRGFCSFLVSGGYKHHLYLPSGDASDSSFDVVKVIISEDKKQFILQDKRQRLSAAIQEKVQTSPQGYAYFSVDLLHEVVSRMKGNRGVDLGTLSINVVFEPSGNQSPTYNLYLPEYGKDKIVEEYGKINSDDADETLLIVINILSQEINELKKCAPEQSHNSLRCSL